MTQKRLLVLGATGGTGQHLLAQAIKAGHDVTALVRSPAKIPAPPIGLRLMTGDVTDGGPVLADAAAGQDAVISALGVGGSLKSGNLIARSVPPIIAAMRQHGVRRLVFTSAIGVGDAVHDAPLFSRVMARLLLADLYRDKAIGEDLVRRSGLDWTIVQPAQLTNGPFTGKYRSGERLKQTAIPKISRADAADFLIRQVDDDRYIGRIVSIAY